MIRKIIRIDKEKCNGCGACADACHEGAIDIINGKAELVREHFCDGLGDCLPECPTGAISFEEREAPEYDEKAVKEDGTEGAWVLDSGDYYFTIGNGAHEALNNVLAVKTDSTDESCFYG